MQATLDELGTPLSATTFVVVDLETTGSRPDRGAGITEIGAVKVCGGEVLAEFETLVDPGEPVPPFITLLTGISQAMVDSAPPVAAVLPDFLSFVGPDPTIVLVAHNAPFDIGFLKSACAAHDVDWPGYPVLDTLPLARRLVSRNEITNHKLATLAGFFGAADQPTHRALADARATAGVLHGLFERLGPYGVQTWEELRSFRSAPTPAQRGKRHLAEGLPQKPGVYVFEDAAGAALYVGKSTNLRKRVQSYFTASETRSRVREMVGLAERVTPIVCGTALEAEVRELRLITERSPTYNRRSRNAERLPWVELTRETFPRLSVVRRTDGDAHAYLGPFSSVREAELAREAVHQTFRIRQCTQRIKASRPVRACALAGMGRCGAPCEGAEDVEEYSAHTAAAAHAMSADVSPVVEALTAHIADLAGQLRYEEAAVHRDRLAAFVKGATRAQRLQAIATVAHLVAARPDGPDWELCVVRHGRLAGTARMPPGSDPHSFLKALVDTAETVAPGRGPAPRASAAETECVLRWLEGPLVRLLELEHDWASPLNGAQKYLGLTDWDRAAPFTQR
ncbi:DNA polymerase III subunit epsilon [Nocardiopsis ansamitocini]|uniref:DNA polymerase III subunit epsilon n=2 Tax=Nocardiopsis ansamitocini TaxID=1670832 RepID=A0A9W6UH82_9ACTN|nr:DEDD exonuclease domain-containing protein [Nocardiopsis ansamitocini]GLU46083.1 DNA polymerase III subunit epsilon [Nocardiopsis ansamitocini]